MIICCCFTEKLKELRNLALLAFPSMVLNSLEVGIIVVNLLMLGHHGKGDIAAAAIGYAYYNIVWYFIEGVLTSQDTLCATAYGRRDFDALRYWSYVSSFVVSFLCLFGTLAFLFSPVLIQRMAGTNSRTSAKAIEFVLFSIPGLWCQAWYRVIQKYLQAQSIMFPAVQLSFLGLSVNALGNVLLLYLFGFGFMGFVLAAQIARLVMLVGMVWHLKTNSLEYDRITSEVTKLWKNIAQEKRVKATCSQVFSAVEKILPSLQWLYGKVSEGIGKNLRALSASLPLYLPESLGRVAPSPKLTADDDSDELTAKVFSPMLLSHSPTAFGGAGGRRAGVECGANDGGGVELTEVQLNEHEDWLDGGSSSIALLSNKEARQISVRQLLAGCGKFAVIGLPGGFMLLIELWSIDLSIVLVAHLGNNALDAHVILLTIVHYFHVSIVFAISVAGSTRVATLLGAQQPYLAKTAAWLTFYMGAIAVVFITLIVYYGWYVIGVIFTSDEYVIQRMSHIAHIVAAFQAFYGLQGAVQGSLRGLGFQLPLAGLSFLGFWVVGIPTGFYMCFVCRPRFGLEGFWYGFLTGAGMLSLLLMVMLLLVNWEKETRRCVFRAERRNRDDSDIISYPQPGSMSVGSVSIEHFVGATDERDMAELEAVEHESATVSKIHQKSSEMTLDI